MDSSGRKELYEVGWDGVELEGEDVASVWRKDCRLCRSRDFIDSSLAIFRGQITSGSPNVTAVAEGRFEFGPPVISDLDEKVSQLYRQGPQIQLEFEWIFMLNP